MPRVATRLVQVNLGLSPQAKRRLERAAARADKALTDFVVDAALRQAEVILKKQDVTPLTAEEWERFNALLLDPPQPNDRFKRAISEHKRIVR